MCSHEEPFTLGQGGHTAMVAFDWRLEGAKTFPLNCPELVHTLIAAGQYMLTILQWHNMGDGHCVTLERIMEAPCSSIKTCIA